MKRLFSLLFSSCIVRSIYITPAYTYCTGQGISTSCTPQRSSYQEQAFRTFATQARTREDISRREDIEKNIQNYTQRLVTLYGEALRTCIEQPSETACAALTTEDDLKKILNFSLFKQYFQSYQQSYTKNQKALHFTAQ